MNLLQELILFKYQTYFEVYHILHILTRHLCLSSSTYPILRVSLLNKFYTTKIHTIRIYLKGSFLLDDSLLNINILTTRTCKLIKLEIIKHMEYSQNYLKNELIL